MKVVSTLLDFYKNRQEIVMVKFIEKLVGHLVELKAPGYEEKFGFNDEITN